MALAGVLWGLMTICLFKAFQYLEASEAAIIIAAESIVTIISAVIFLNEQFTLRYAIGAGLILSSIVLISWNKKSTFKLNRGVLYALGVCLFGGLGITNDAFVMKEADPLSYLCIAFLLPGFFIILIQPHAVLKIGDFLQKSLFIKMLALTVVFSFAALTFYSALGLGAPASQLGTINQSSVILTILLSAFILKERDRIGLKILSAILVTIGVYLLG